jgi:hypothetical protein
MVRWGTGNPLPDENAAWHPANNPEITRSRSGENPPRHADFIAVDYKYVRTYCSAPSLLEPSWLGASGGACGAPGQQEFGATRISFRLWSNQ